ncbi:MAG: TolC family protein [Thermoanaerobaculia bacterium]|nr:TolC family protein [Thermoanaerobaculia bacterium]
MTKSSSFTIGRGAFAAWILVGAVALTALPVVTDDTVQFSLAIDEDVAPSGLTVTGNEITLTVEQAVAIALERNLGLLVQRYERAQFELQISENLGIYDTNVSSQLSLAEEASPSATELDGAAVLSEETRNLGIDVSQLTPWGGTGQVLFNTFNRDSNSTFSNLNPFFSTDLDVRFSQPLLRDFGKAVTNRGIKIARLSRDISHQALEQQVTNTIQSVVNAHFTLVEAREQVAVARESRDLAVELHDMNKVRVEVGTLAPLELISSEVGISTREEEIIRAEQAVGDAEDDLRTLLNLEEGALWNVSIIPQASEDPRKVANDLDAAIEMSMEMRPEIASKRLELEQLGIDSTYYRNQTLPSLAASLTYGYNGLGGDLIERAPNGDILSVTPGGFGDSVDQIRDRDFDGWRFEVNFGFPLQNRTAKSRKARADLNVEQAQLEFTQLTQEIRTEVRKAVRAVRSAEKQIDSSAASVRLAEKNLDAERKRYENGLSTSFQVLEIQEDLSQARSRAVSAVASYRRALAEYHRATGGLLGVSGVEWDKTPDVE